MDFLKLHKVWIAAAAAGLISFLNPSVNAFVVTHPQYAVIVGTLTTVAAAWAKSPRQAV